MDTRQQRGVKVHAMETQVLVTALGPDDPDDGEAGRQMRGLAIAALTTNIRKNRLGYAVPSQSGNGSYVVNFDGEPVCSCPDFEKRGLFCKHLYAVELIIQREERPDGTTIETQGMRVTYGQDWAAYNAAQTHEYERFLPLLRELCDGIEQPAQTKGRPRLLLSDVVFALGVKTYSTLSARRATSLVRDAATRGLMDAAPSYNSALRYLESAEMTDVLTTLIEESAKPLASVESHFAADSTGIGTTTYRRWFDHKWGKERSKQTWVKVHAMVGAKTNIVTAIYATPGESADSPQLPTLLDRTTEAFDVKEVSADRAYSSRSNLHAIHNAGAMAYIPFKKGSTAAVTHHKFDGLWSRMWAYYQYKQAEFLERYHQRSNVETTFAMVKAKFGGSVRAKTPTAQVNEALLKFVCHNIVVLIQSIYELGIAPAFWSEPDCPKSRETALNLTLNPLF